MACAVSNLRAGRRTGVATPALGRPASFNWVVDRPATHAERGGVPGAVLSDRITGPVPGTTSAVSTCGLVRRRPGPWSSRWVIPITDGREFEPSAATIPLAQRPGPGDWARRWLAPKLSVARCGHRRQPVAAPRRGAGGAQARRSGSPGIAPGTSPAGVPGRHRAGGEINDIGVSGGPTALGRPVSTPARIIAGYAGPGSPPGAHLPRGCADYLARPCCTCTQGAGYYSPAGGRNSHPRGR